MNRNVNTKRIGRHWSFSHRGAAALALAACAISAAHADCTPQWDNAIGVPGMNGSVQALMVYNGDLIAGGDFAKAGGAAANGVAKSDGSQWSPFGAGLSGSVQSLAVFDNGSGDGPALYAGGWFSSSAGWPVNRIARWSGSSWSTVGGSIPSNPNGWWIDALAVFDDGDGPALYAAGWFEEIGDIAANHIAKWDGTSWSALGEGMGVDDPDDDPVVWTLLAFTNDTGIGLESGLYAGGYFTTAGGQSAIGVARWDGSQWSPLGSGLDGDVNALVVFDDGSGPALYAGGGFDVEPDGSSIAKWNGSQWTSVGSVDCCTFDLAVFDDGTGPALYAAGMFSWADGPGAKGIVRWSGSQWSPLGAGVGGEAYALAADGGAPTLFVGGWFNLAGGESASNIASIVGCPADEGCVFETDCHEPDGTIHSCSISCWEESAETLIIGDGNNQVSLNWSVNTFNKGWFSTTFGMQIAHAPGVTDIAQITDASKYNFVSGGSIGPICDATCSPTGVGEFVVVRSTSTGFYGVLRVDEIDVVDIFAPEAYLSGQWWFQANGTADFSSTGQPDPKTLHVPSEYATIQAAIDAAAFDNDDTVLVAPGTYNEAITFNGKTITVKSSRGAAATTIDASGLDQTAVLVPGGSGEGTRLEGFTITGGNALGGGINTAYGGGLRVHPFSGTSAVITIADCIFIGNSADDIAAGCGGGGAAVFNAADVTFENCTFSSNSAGRGGAVLTWGNVEVEPVLTFINCTFDDNSSAFQGGAVDVNNLAHAVVLDSTFTGNHAGTSGGGVAAGPGTTVQITGTSIVGNTADSQGGAVHVGGPLGDIPAAIVDIASTEVCNNSPNDFSGEPWNDLGGNTIGEACDPGEPGIPGDLTGSGSVGVPDLLILLGAWGECADCAPGMCPADLTGDCSVGVPDLLILLGNWG